MKKQILPIVCLFSLCIVLLARTNTTNAQAPLVFAVQPVSKTVNTPGEEFTVNITVADAPAVAFYQFNMTWNPAILNITDPENDIRNGDFMDGIFLFKYNTSIPGIIEEVTNGMLSGTVSGNGTLASINFTSVAMGTTVLKLEYGAMLDETMKIAFWPELVDGSITVIPEFPINMVIPIFLITTAVFALLAKVTISRRRQVPIFQ